MSVSDIDTKQIQHHLDAIWSIGRTDSGGVTRLAYTDEETAAIKYITDQFDDSFTMETDQVGNVFVTREPNAEQSLLLGSHLDSVFNGGRLDGALGVVVALEAIETAYDVGSPPIAPTLAIFRSEESSRFGQWGIGSRGALGLLKVEDLSATDQSNVPLWQAMQEADLQPKNLSDPTIDLDRVAGFFEVHIEQGRVLDEANKHLGIVDSIRGPVRYHVTVDGDYDHSGATPMGLRRDAVAGGAEMVTAIERIATDAAADGDLVATVGEFAPNQGAINKVCGKATFSIDVRSNNRPYRDDIEKMILNRLQTIANERDLNVATDLVDRSDPVELSNDTREALSEIASSLNFDYRQIPSGGGHDAMNFQSVGISTGMVFVPSINGISHNPQEKTQKEAIDKAAAVLTQVILDPPHSG